MNEPSDKIQVWTDGLGALRVRVTQEGAGDMNRAHLAAQVAIRGALTAQGGLRPGQLVSAVLELSQSKSGVVEHTYRKR